MPAKKAAGNFLTRKIGPFPGWVWGLGAAGLGLIYFYSVGKSGGSSAGTPASLAASPAASTIPFVPSVTVTGLPPNTAAGTSSGSAPVSGGGVLINGGWPSGKVALWAGPTPKSGMVTTVSDGTMLPSAGAPVPGDSAQSSKGTSTFWQPVTYNGLRVYAWAPDVQAQPGSGGGPDGSGGAGVSGLGAPLVTSMMGWTSGWVRQGTGWPISSAALQGGRGDGPVAAGGDNGSGGGGGATVARFTAARRSQARIRLQRRIGAPPA